MNACLRMVKNDEKHLKIMKKVFLHEPLVQMMEKVLFPDSSFSAFSTIRTHAIAGQNTQQLQAFGSLYLGSVTRRHEIFKFSLLDENIQIILYAPKINLYLSDDFRLPIQVSGGPTIELVSYVFSVCSVAHLLCVHKKVSNLNARRGGETRKHRFLLS